MEQATRDSHPDSHRKQQSASKSRDMYRQSETVEHRSDKKLKAWRDDGSERGSHSVPRTCEEECSEIEVCKLLDDLSGPAEAWETFVIRHKDRVGGDAATRVDIVERALAVFRGEGEDLVHMAVDLMLDMKRVDFEETNAYKLLNDQVQEFKEAEEKVRETIEELRVDEAEEGGILKLRNVLSSTQKRAECEKVQLLIRSIDKLGDYPIFTPLKESSGKNKLIRNNQK